MGLSAIALGSTLSQPTQTYAYEPSSEMLSKASDAQVVMFGEWHVDQKGETFTKNEEYISEMLPYLKQKGFTHLCIEVDSHAQNTFDSYAHGRIGKDRAVKQAIEAIPNVKSLENDVLTFDEEEEKRLAYLPLATVKDYKARFIRIMVPAVTAQLDETKIAHDNEMALVMYDDQTFRYSENGKELEKKRDEQQFRNLESLIKEGKKLVVHCGNNHMRIPTDKNDRRDKKRLAEYIKEASDNKLFRVTLKPDFVKKDLSLYCDMVVNLE